MTAGDYLPASPLSLSARRENSSEVGVIVQNYRIRPSRGLVLNTGWVACVKCVPESLTFLSITPGCKCHDRTHTFSPVIKWNFVLMALFGRVLLLFSLSCVDICTTTRLTRARLFYAVMKNSVFAPAIETKYLLLL